MTSTEKTSAPLKHTTLKLFGILSMTSAIMALPLSLLSLQFEGRHDDFAKMIILLLYLSGTVIFVLLIGAFRMFLVRNCSFYKANALIYILILLNIVYAATSCIDLYLGSSGDYMRYISLAQIFVLGVFQTLLGTRLFQLPMDLGGIKRPYCWLNVLTGIFLASVILMPLGLITSAVADVMLGTIFFNEAKLLSPPSTIDNSED